MIQSIEVIELIPVDSLVEVAIFDDIVIGSTFFALHELAVQLMQVAHFIWGQSSHVVDIHIDAFLETQPIAVARWHFSLVLVIPVTMQFISKNVFCLFRNLVNGRLVEG